VAIGREEVSSEDATEPRAMASPIPSPTLPPSPAAPEPARPPSAARFRWAQLLARLYEVLPLLCPACGGEMKILAFLTEPPTVEAILLHLDLPHRPPAIMPARGPPQAELSFDQTSEFDPADGEPEPDFEFDPSFPEDWVVSQRG